MERTNETLIFEQPLNDGKESITILFGGQNSESPKGFMDNIVREYVGKEPYNDFIEITLTEPRVRVIIKGINDINFDKYLKNTHSLKTINDRFKIK